MTAAEMKADLLPQSLRGALAEVAMSVADDDDLFTTGISWDLDHPHSPDRQKP